MPHTQKTQRERSAPYKATTTSSVVLKEDTSAMNPGEQQPLQMTGSQILKEASRIMDFDGRDLSSFIREVDMILPLFNPNPSMLEFVTQRHVKTKIKGEAASVIRPLGPTPTWQQMREELIKNVGVKEPYHTLYNPAIVLRNYNVSQYLQNLKDILDKLNLKHEFDRIKPIEFSPINNESLILKTFLNGIHPNLSSVVISRNISTIREAFSVLQETGLLIQFDKRQNNYQRNNYRNFSNRNSLAHNFGNFNNKQYMQNSNNFQFGQNQQREFRNNSNQNDNYQQFNFGQSRQNNSEQFSFGQNRQNNYQQSRRYNSVQRRQNPPEPMEIDHVQEQANFRLPAQNNRYR